MKLLITGGTGFIGKALVAALIKKGHEPVFLTRNPKKVKEAYDSAYNAYAWNALSGPPPKEAFEGIDGIINLMGESVANKRWTSAQKQKIKDTRVLGSKNLLKGAQKHAKTIKVVVSSSAIGIYEHSAQGPLTEASPQGTGFLAQVCKEWEAAANELQTQHGTRTVIIRTGIVLGNGGALQKMLTPFKLGLGGSLGSGKQYMNWVHIDDLVQLYINALENDSLSGPYNGVSPKNASNSQFTKTLGKVLKRPTIFPVPAFAIKLLFGEFSGELLAGAEVSANKTLESGLNYHYPTLEDALKSICNKR